MTSPTSPSVHQIAALGLAGTVVAAGSPVGAFAQEPEGTSPVAPMQCEVSAPQEVQGAPTEQDIAAKEADIARGQAVRPRLVENIAQAQEEKEQAEQALRQAEADPDAGQGLDDQQLEEAERDRARLAEEMRLAQEEYDRLQAETAQLSERVDLAALAQDFARMDLEEATARAESAQENYDELLRAEGPQSPAYQDAERQEQAADAESQEASAAQDAAQEDAARLDAELLEKNNELTQAQADQDANTEQTQDVTARIDSADQDIAAREQEITQATNEKDALEQQINNLDQEIAAEEAQTNQPTTPTTGEEPPAQPGVYTSFSALINALNQGSTDVTLGSDLDASEVADDQSAPAYVTSDYSSTFNGAGYTIRGLSRPLFHSLTSDAQVQDVSLADVRVTSPHHSVGALANQATNARIRGIHVTGSVAGSRTVGGVLGEATSTMLVDATVQGNVRSTTAGEAVNLGGIVGHMSGGTLTQAGFHGNIDTFNNGSAKNRVGGVVGHLEGRATAGNVYAGGNLNNARQGAQAGGLVGSMWSDSGQHGRLRNAVSAMNVNNGMQVHGDHHFTASSIAGVSLWEGESAGTAEDTTRPGRIFEASAQDAQDHYDSLSLSRDIRPGAEALPQTSTALAADRRIAYENFRVLLPNADDEARVRAANALPASDPLVTKKLTSAVPTVNGSINVDSVRDASAIDGLILHFSDRTVDRRSLIRDTRQGAPAGTYYMGEGIPYTTDQPQSVDTAVVQRAAQALKDIQWADVVLPDAESAIAEFKDEASARGALYLRETVDKQREGLERQVHDLIAREIAASRGKASAAAIEKKILDHKDAVLLGLAYVNKWYDIDFDGTNLRDIMVFRRDFYGAQESPLDTLIRLGSSYALLDPRKNVDTYLALNYHATHNANLHDELDRLRQQFTTYDSFDSWFKATTKAYLVEAPSAERPDIDVRVTTRLAAHRQYHNMFLPLLTVSEGSVWIINNMTSVAFGSFERYYDVNRAKTPEAIAAKVAEIKTKVNVAAEKSREYYDLWYRIGNDTMKKNLITNVPVWDGFSYDLGWTDRFGPGNFASVEEFYGPIGRWFPANGLSGYSNKNGTWMVVSGMLNAGYDLSIYTHEQTHNLSYRVMLGGYGERKGSHPELYPTGLLQNPYSRAHGTFGFNQSDHFAGQNGSYFHNEHPDRFTSLEDLNRYFKEYFQALYLLDNLEADAIVSQSDEDKARLLMQLENRDHEGYRSINSYQPLTAEQIAPMDLRSISDLVRNELMIRRGYTPGRVIGAISYASLGVLNPLYGTAESSLGLTGDAAFKRNAYELWAAKGFEEGWVPYASNKLLDEARAAGLDNMPDTFVMSKIFAGDGISSLSEYRQRAYEENRRRAQTQMKPITVTFLNQTETYTSYDQISERFKQLMQADLAVDFQNNENLSRVYLFKQALFSAIMAQTQEFRTSIFSDGDADQPTRVEPKTAQIVTPGVQPARMTTPELEIDTPGYDNPTVPTQTGNGADGSTAPDAGNAGGSDTGSDSGQGAGSDSDRLRELRAQREVLRQQLATVTARLAQKNEQQRQAQASRDSDAAQLGSLQQRATQIAQRIEQLRVDIAELERQQDAARAEEEAQNRRLNAALTRMNDARSAREQMDANVQIAHRLLTEVREAQAQEASNYEQTSRDLTHKRQILSEHQAKMAELLKQLQQLQADLDRVNALIAAGTRNQVSEAQGRLNNAEVRYQAALSELEEYDAFLQTMRQELQAMREERAQAIARHTVTSCRPGNYLLADELPVYDVPVELYEELGILPEYVLPGVLFEAVSQDPPIVKLPIADISEIPREQEGNLQLGGWNLLPLIQRKEDIHLADRGEPRPQSEGKSTGAVATGEGEVAMNEAARGSQAEAPKLAQTGANSLALGAGAVTTATLGAWMMRRRRQR